MQLDPPMHTVSFLYNLLTKIFSGPPYFVKWERELGVTFAEEDVCKSCILTHKFSVASNGQERNYNIIPRWYCYPWILHKIFLSTSDQCWQSLSHVGTTYGGIATFCIHFEIMFLKYSFCPNTVPQIASLFMFPEPVLILGSRFYFFVVAVRVVIPRYWKSQCIPSITDCIIELNNLMRMEKLSVQFLDRWSNFQERCLPWISFMNNPNFATPPS